MAGPLDGVKVIEIGVWVAGPAAGAALADWGANVIKIEPPEVGDPARTFARMLGSDLPFNPPFEMDNRNKRSVVIDLSTKEGLAIALELIDEADVFLSNVRPIALKKLGLNSEILLKRNPRLIYAILTGYGLNGPDKDSGAYDIAAFWARSGVAGGLQRPGEAPPFQRGGMGDHNAGLSCAGAVAAALYSREKTGNGQVVSTSLLRQGIYTISFDIAVCLRYGQKVSVSNRKAIGNPCINNYKDSEGKWFWLVGLEGDRHWPPLTRVIDHPEWQQDERFNTAVNRAVNADELITALDEIFSRKTRDQWAEIFSTEEELFWAPVNTVDEVVNDTQAIASGAFVEIPDGMGTTLLPATPSDFLGTPCEQRNMAPEHGEHSEEILAELGHSTNEIVALRKMGVTI